MRLTLLRLPFSSVHLGTSNFFMWDKIIKENVRLINQKSNNQGKKKNLNTYNVQSKEIFSLCAKTRSCGDEKNSKAGNQKREEFTSDISRLKSKLQGRWVPRMPMHPLKYSNGC